MPQHCSLLAEEINTEALQHSLDCFDLATEQLHKVLHLIFTLRSILIFADLRVHHFFQFIRDGLTDELLKLFLIKIGAFNFIITAGIV